MGTGAFSTARIERQVSIKVVPDNEALLSLRVPYSGDTIQIDDGRLTIDAAEGDDDEGVKAGSTHEFGDWNPSSKVVTPTIQVMNKGSQAQNVEFSYSWDQDNIGSSSMRWFFSWQPTGQNKKQFTVDNSQSEAGITARNITPGNPINIAFRVTADEAHDDISGEISLESTATEKELPSHRKSDT
ncbi:hypothetical protein [Halorubrum xinjiangense]|uniref:hypothetical protein n=1 Tax=Halorubrum xinjiangense TaxID=261291 RepID=UPI00165F0C45|nr:hypothetical protein [Halorubrum xinjiangense]